MKLGLALPRTLVVLGVVSAVSWTMNLLGLAYIARTLTSATFGLLVFGFSMTAYATVIAAPGLNVWGIRAVSRNHEAAGKYLVIVNGSQFVLGIVAYGLLTAFALTVLAEDERSIVMVAGIGVFSAFAGTQWLCQALERYDVMALSLLVTSVTTLTGFAIFVHGPDDIYVIPVVMLASQLVASCITFAVLSSAALVHLTFVNPRQILEALSTTIALGVAPVIITIFHNANTLILQVSRGSEAVGFFSSGYRLVELLSLVPTLVTSLFFSRLSRLPAGGESWEATMRAFVSLIMSLAFFPAMLLVVEAESVTRFLYGAEYEQAAPVVRIMGLAVLFNFAAIAYLMAILAAHYDRDYLVALGATAVFAVGAGLAVVPSLGLVGATFVVSAIDLVAWLLTLRVMRRLSGGWFLAEWGRPAIAASAIGICLVLAAEAGVPFVARITIAATLYAAAVFVKTTQSQIGSLHS